MATATPATTSFIARPDWLRRSSHRKKGAPSAAVKMVIGNSFGRSTVRVARSTSTRNVAPVQHRGREHPAVVGADDEPGGVRDHQPDEADGTGDRDRRGGEQRRAQQQPDPQPGDVHTERGGVVVAAHEGVQSAGLQQQSTSRSRG